MQCNNKESAMKVVLTDKVRALQKDVQGARELRDFIASAKLNETKEIKVTAEQGKQLKFRAKLVPQG
ncbi:hypothetical protein A4G86_21790 [Burkholderia pseudomallei]|nr:hypothetical protein A4G86_21790 [Burkholderia pseudomallei]RAQ89503.1 hypothetical protein A4G85_21180 [Burkholderia pseudomallei]